MGLRIKKKKVYFFSTGLIVYRVIVKDATNRDGKIESAYNWEGER